MGYLGLGLRGLHGMDLNNPEVRRSIPAPILNASWSAKLGVALGLPVSFYGVYSISFFPKPKGHIDLGLLIGLACATYCAIAVFMFCWSSAAAYFIRKSNFPPSACFWAGLPFMVAGVLSWVHWWFSSGGNGSAGPLLCWGGVWIVYLCQKLAYAAPPK
jgi:hypothetical protein